MGSAKIIFQGRGPYTVDEAFEAAIFATCERVQRSELVVRGVLNAVEFKGVLARAFGDKVSTEAIFTPAPEPRPFSVKSKAAPKTKPKPKTKKNPEGPESSKDANGPPKKTRKKRA